MTFSHSVASANGSLLSPKYAPTAWHPSATRAASITSRRQKPLMRHAVKSNAYHCRSVASPLLSRAGSVRNDRSHDGPHTGGAGLAPHAASGPAGPSVGLPSRLSVSRPSVGSSRGVGAGGSGTVVGVASDTSGPPDDRGCSL